MAAEFKERRRYPRYPCDTGVRVHPEKGNAGYWGTLSDISYGGCYIYTFSPLTAGQMITLVIKANDVEINVAGKVVSSHPGVGMGIAFQGFIQEDGEARLKAYIDYLSKQPQAKDSVAVFH
jgi:PilZ domain-containing protein